MSFNKIVFFYFLTEKKIACLKWETQEVWCGLFILLFLTLPMYTLYILGEMAVHMIMLWSNCEYRCLPFIQR